MHASDKSSSHNAGESRVLLSTSKAFHLTASFPRMQLVKNIAI